MNVGQRTALAADWCVRIDTANIDVAYQSVDII